MLNQDAAVRQGVAQGADADARAGPLMAEDPVDAHELPTPHSTLQALYLAVLLTCRSCLRNSEADPEALIAAGHGDAPLIQLCWWCSYCRSRRVAFVVTSRSAAQRAGLSDPAAQDPGECRLGGPVLICASPVAHSTYGQQPPSAAQSRGSLPGAPSGSAGSGTGIAEAP